MRGVDDAVRSEGQVAYRHQVVSLTNAALTVREDTSEGHCAVPWSERDVSIIITINLALCSVGCGVSRRAITLEAGGSFLHCQTFVSLVLLIEKEEDAFVTIVRNDPISAG